MAHIGIDARLTHYRTGGISTYIRALLSALAHQPADHQFTVFRSRKSHETLEPAFPHRDLWTPSHNRIERTALSLELSRHRLDVLHSPDFIPPWRGARRHVITVHDLTFLHYPDYLTADSRRYYNDQIAWACHHADHILAVSEATKRDLIQMLHVAADKITVQPHGVHPRYQPMTADEITQCLGQYDLSAGYLLHVGTIEPRKNIGGLLEAYTQLVDHLPDVPPLVLVGRVGWLADELLARINTTPNVIHLTDISDETLPALYNGAHALVMPSFYEGFGLPPLEAMACGTLPLVSDHSSLPEVVGDVGLRFDPDDTDAIVDSLITALTADSDWLRHQQDAAMNRAATFTWERSAQIALRVYEAVL